MVSNTKYCLNPKRIKVLNYVSEEYDLTKLQNKNLK